MTRSRRVSDRLKELKQVEKRIQRELLCEIARTVVRSFDYESKTLDTKGLVDLINENWDFLSKKFKIKTRKSEVGYEN